MANCTYTLKGTTFNSYSELLDFLDTKNLDLSKISDIVFSKVQKQELLILKILDIKHEYKPKNTSGQTVSSGINGEPEVEGRLSILDYLDSPECAINGRTLITPMSKADYVEATVAKMMKDTSLSYTEELCRAIVNNTVKNWNTIQEDALLLHSMFTDKAIRDRNALDVDFIKNYKNEIKDTRITEALMKLLFEGLKKAFYIREKGKYPNSRGLTNVNLISKVKNTSREIFGHIDYLFVGEDGTLHLYLFKTTSESPFNWANVKLEKYKYLLAFLKHMLADNGINVNNIDLNIVPVQLSYNLNFSKINSIRVLNAIPYSTRYSGAEYSMAKYDRLVDAFISNNSAAVYTPELVVLRADDVNRAIFPELNIKAAGYMGLSARMWIATAPSVDPTGTEPLVIKEVNDGYLVVIKGKVFDIKSKKAKNKNEEIYNLVSKYVELLEDYKGYAALRLKELLNTSFKKGFLDIGGIKGFEGSERRLNAVFGKYLSEYEENPVNNEKVYDWELLPDLVDANVLIFRNKKTKVIDIVSISTFDLNAMSTFNKGSNLLGSYRRDIASDKSDLLADWGNIEGVRAMELLNEIILTLQKANSDIKLGNISVLSAVGNNYFRTWDIGSFNKNYFLNILLVVNTENPKLKAKNNFKDSQFVDPIETILGEYLRAMEGKSQSGKNRLSSYGFDLLVDAETTDLKIKILQNLIGQIYATHRSFSNPQEVYNALNGTKGSDKEIASLLISLVRAYANVTGEAPVYLTKLTPMDEYMFTPATIPDPNILTVVSNLQTTHDTIAAEFLRVFDRSIFDNYYKQIGYTGVLNMFIGNQALLYKNLYEVDIRTGKKTMSFKNPYDYSNNLTSPERELLKKVLYLIAWINTNGNFKFSSWADPKLSEYVKQHPEYLWVPLEKASASTSRQSSDAILARIKNGFRRLVRVAESFDEFVNGVSYEERLQMEEYGKDFYNLQLKNPFELSMLSSNSGVAETIKSRLRMIEKYGPEYFETNVENILIDFLVKHISTTQFNKYLIGSKALLLQLHLTGDFGGNQATVLREIEWLLKYLKVNVFNTSIMSSSELKIIGVISPVKTVVSHMLVGGNIVGAFRDIMEGALQNFIRAALKYNTDLTPSNVAKAYAYVSTHATSNAMAVNLLSKLCLKYRLSNTDVGRIAERAKTLRNGIFSYDNILYSTLRSPDFLNRMTLFVARCMQDGVWDAFSIDKDNNLAYDWKKDARFSIYAQGLTNHPDYNKLRARYLSAVRQYNEEHSDNPIDIEEGLPTPYSEDLIMNIRNTADNIYGAYDRGKRAMAENTSLGIVFGMFSTWFNGIVNNYFMKPQRNGAYGLREVLELDETGRPLYYDKNGGITTADTGVPVLKNIPIVVQGILPTISTLSDIFRTTESNKWKSIRDYLNANPHEKANMRKLLSDLLMLMLFASLFNLAITPAYKNFKKTMPENPVLVNLVTEILYKSSSRAYDQYKGPINVIQFFGENMNPPTYSLPTQLIKTAALTLFGDKSFKYLLFNSSGLMRSFKDTGFAYIKSQLQWPIMSLLKL